MNVVRLFLIALLAGVASLCPAQETTIHARLLNTATATGPVIRLGEIARLSGGTEQDRILLAGVPLTEAPAPGFTAHLSRREIERLLNAAGVYGTLIEGANSVDIVTASTLTDPSAMVKLAQTALINSLHTNPAQISAEPQAPLPMLHLPHGQVSFRIRNYPPQPLHPLMTVWVDVLLDGNYYQTVPVTFRISAMETVWIARTSLPKHMQPGCANLEQRQTDVSSLPSPPLAGDCASFGLRLRRDLQAGDVLLGNELEPVPAISEGDTVKLELSEGGINIEAGALALTDGLIGQQIPVQATTSKEAVIATVIAPDTVNIRGR